MCTERLLDCTLHHPNSDNRAGTQPLYFVICHHLDAYTKRWGAGLQLPRCNNTRLTYPCAYPPQPEVIPIVMRDQRFRSLTTLNKTPIHPMGSRAPPIYSEPTTRYARLTHSASARYSQCDLPAITSRHMNQAQMTTESWRHYLERCTSTSRQKGRAWKH